MSAQRTMRGRKDSCAMVSRPGKAGWLTLLMAGAGANASLVHAALPSATGALDACATGTSTSVTLQFHMRLFATPGASTSVPPSIIT